MLYSDSIPQQEITDLKQQEKETWNKFKAKRSNYFHAIRQAKTDSWLNFLKNAKDKEIFKAYKYTKSNQVEKLPAIQHNDQSHITFDEKCKAFLQAMYPKQNYINQSQNLRYQTNNQI